MQLPFNLASTLPPKLIGSATAEPLEKGEDAEARMEQAGQFSSLLTQAMTQQAPELPAPASAEDAGATSPDSLATAEGPVELSLMKPTDVGVTDTAGEEGPPKPEAPVGFPVNLLATLQSLLHPSPQPNPSPQAIAETTVVASPQPLQALSSSNLPDVPQAPNLPGTSIAAPMVSAVQGPAALPIPALGQRENTHQASAPVIEPFLQPGTTEKKLLSEESPAVGSQRLSSQDQHSESADSVGMIDQLPPQNAGFNQVLSMLDAQLSGFTPPVMATANAPESQGYQPVAAASLPLSGAQGGLPEPLPVISSAPTQTPAFQLPGSPSSAGDTAFTQSPSVTETNVIGTLEGLPLPKAEPVSASGGQVALPQAVSESAFGEIAFSMGPVTRQTPGLEGQKPGKLEELQKQLSQLGGSIEASTNQTVPVGSPFVTANQSIPQAEVSKPTATDEPFAIPAEEAPLSEAFPSQPDSSTVEPSAASIPGTSSGVPGNSGSSQGSPPQFVSQARHPMEQVLEGTAYSVKNGHKELNIRLNPDNLGEVRVNLVSLGNNELSARLIASTPESHALLQSQADTLKTSLEAQGIRVEHLTVVLAGSQDARGNMGQGTGSDQQQQHYQQSSGHSGNLAQQDFNREDQPGSNVFAQMNQSGGGPFQQKSGFAQNPISGPYRSVSDDAASLETSRTEARSQSHDNGSISILA